MKINELELGKIYDIKLKKEDENREATIECLRYTSNQKWSDGTITDELNRFESLLNATALVLDSKGNLVGDLKDYSIIDITESEPRIIKTLQIKESELNKQLDDLFSTESQKIFEFIKNL